MPDFACKWEAPPPTAPLEAIPFQHKKKAHAITPVFTFLKPAYIKNKKHTITKFQVCSKGKAVWCFWRPIFPEYVLNHVPHFQKSSCQIFKNLLIPFQFHLSISTMKHHAALKLYLHPNSKKPTPLSENQLKKWNVARPACGVNSSA